MVALAFFSSCLYSNYSPFLFIFQIAGEPFLSAQDRIATPAVLDIKWNYTTNTQANAEKDINPACGESSFAVAYEDGSVRLYSVSDDAKQHKMKELSTVQVSHNNALCLSLDWNTRRVGLPNPPPGDENDEEETNEYDEYDDYEQERVDTPAKAVTSLSDGSVAVLDVDYSAADASQCLSVRHHWKAHDMEAWIAAFDYWNPKIVYSGSDDTLFKQWDLRLVPEVTQEEHDDEFFEPSKRVPAILTSKEHKGGVCSIRAHPYNPHLLATGSYDEHLRIWDKRNMRTPIISKNLSGGVWRIKWHPDPARSNTMLVTNMYNGLHVVDLVSPHLPASAGIGAFSSTPSTLSDDRKEILDEFLEMAAHNHTYNGSDLEISASYNRHGPKSIAYGGDWSHIRDLSPFYSSTAEKNIPNTLVQSASFYNKRVDLWYPSK